MALRPRLNRAHAIREFCLECQNYQRQQINACTDRACPLWEWRRGDGNPEWTTAALRRQIQKHPTASTAEPFRRVLASKTGDSPAISES